MVCFGPQSERERLDLHPQVSVLKEGRVAVDEALKVRSTALVQTVEETAQQRADSSTLRLLQEQMKQSLFDIQHRLSVKTNKVHVAHQQMEKIGELSREWRYPEGRGDCASEYYLCSGQGEG
ncbi:centrosomal protein of 135 kDa-like [Salmo trutta]|uniref:centrosomal protein of 135 kDa-like n=1 Tax=Salmo trutta TaxID=8032 RepID=UPI0011328545|nr:centrosomal protein of 135 kDa-like [Salmo trutta]